jgi:hypothetical protein
MGFEELSARCFIKRKPEKYCSVCPRSQKEMLATLAGHGVLCYAPDRLLASARRVLTIPLVKSNNFFPSVVQTHVPSPLSIIKSFANLPIPGVTCFVPNAGVICEVDIVDAVR